MRVILEGGTEMENQLKIFICTNHDSFYPVGCASIVIAKDRRQARRLLDKKLIEINLRPYDRCTYTLTEIDSTIAKAVILNDGNY